MEEFVNTPLLGNAGRPTDTRYERGGSVLEEEPLDPSGGPAMPVQCQQKLAAPEFFGEHCPPACDGRQEDGSCLREIVRKAHAQGVTPTFRVDPLTLIWKYDGPELA